MTHSYTWHDSFIYGTWRIPIRDMTHSYTWHDSFIYVTWRIPIRDMTHSYTWHDPLRAWDMTHSYVWKVDVLWSELPVDDSTFYVRHDSFIYVTWLIHICDMTHSYMGRDSLRVWDMTHSYVWKVDALWSGLPVDDSLSACDITHPYVRHESFICETPDPFV